MIVITGASATGKSVAAKGLEQYGFKKAITTTTRLPREGEVDGVDYFFVSKEEFEKRIKENKLVEYTLYNENYYGCGVDQVSDDKVIVTDPNGLHAFKRLNKGNLVTFLLLCDDVTRKERMIHRGDKEDKIIERLTNDKKDFDRNVIGEVDFEIDTRNLSKQATIDRIYNLYLTKVK